MWFPLEKYWTVSSVQLPRHFDSLSFLKWTKPEYIWIINVFTLNLLWPPTTFPWTYWSDQNTHWIKLQKFHDFKVGCDSKDYTHILLRKVVETQNCLIIRCENSKVPILFMYHYAQWNSMWCLSKHLKWLKQDIPNIAGVKISK